MTADPQAQPAAKPPRVFDRPLLRRRLARAVADEAEDFLLARAAADLVDRLSIVTRDFRSVLDLGSPRTPVVEALADALPRAAITRLAPVVGSVGTGRWISVVGDEECQPFAAGSFDLAVSCLSLHAVNDLPGALVQLRRALKPDGLFLCCLLGGNTLTELRTALAEAESEISGGVSPRVAPFSDLRDLGGLLQRVGFALPVGDTEPVVVRYRHIARLFSDLRAMGATNALTLRHREPLRRAVLMRAAAIYAERFSDPDGRLRATFDLVWLSGWSPHESQQKPLQPGSAKMSLEAALLAARD